METCREGAPTPIFSSFSLPPSLSMLPRSPPFLSHPFPFYLPSFPLPSSTPNFPHPLLFWSHPLSDNLPPFFLFLAFLFLSPLLLLFNSSWPPLLWVSHGLGCCQLYCTAAALWLHCSCPSGPAFISSRATAAALALGATEAEPQGAGASVTGPREPPSWWPSWQEVQLSWKSWRLPGGWSHRASHLHMCRYYYIEMDLNQPNVFFKVFWLVVFFCQCAPYPQICRLAPPILGYLIHDVMLSM